jgi:mannitol-specific phosphotransferase system IIBC component
VDIATLSGLILAIGIAVAVSVLLNLMLLKLMRDLRQDLARSLAQTEETNSQLQALRQELHVKKPHGQTPPPRSRSPAEDETLFMQRPASVDETVVIRRR